MTAKSPVLNAYKSRVNHNDVTETGRASMGENRGTLCDELIALAEEEVVGVDDGDGHEDEEAEPLRKPSSPT